MISVINFSYIDFLITIYWPHNLAFICSRLFGKDAWKLFLFPFDITVLKFEVNIPKATIYRD